MKNRLLKGLYLKREIKVSGAVLATAILLLLIATASHTCAAGACDTEDFYPSSYYHSKWSYTDSSGQKRDYIFTDNLWTKKSQYFTSDNYFSFDFYRTVSCTDGTDKDVYDFWNYLTNLPSPVRIDVEEWRWWDPTCYAVPRMCNEEVEIGTKSPQNIQTNT
ncbi:hypothetical protein [Pyrobaculum ferrireducens]|uniref:Uncharacterized protein n=1 Tax=Pyrobaculum ferrireducens TaxID=1104324 RepID=G7VEG3_9CREN|nr:hypothetical protein [Pyrobaculum ferrireducens]AET31587.1 hypothetical protein P186_0119 [Pyrobaculum ferrireducens]